MNHRVINYPLGLVFVVGVVKRSININLVVRSKICLICLVGNHPVYTLYRTNISSNPTLRKGKWSAQKYLWEGMYVSYPEDRDGNSHSFSTLWSCSVWPNDWMIMHFQEAVSSYQQNVEWSPTGHHLTWNLAVFWANHHFQRVVSTFRHFPY